MTHKEANAAFDRKVRKGIFKPVARHLKNEQTAEDRMAVGVAMTWEMFKRYGVEKDRVLSNGLLVNSCRQRAVDLNRRFVPVGGGCANQDVLDARAYRDARVEVLRLEGVANEGDDSLEIGYAEAMCIRPERKLISAMDLESWIGGLDSTDQLLMQKKMEGYSYGVIAADLSMSYSQVYTRSKTLGYELASRAGVKIQKRKRV